MRTDIPNFSSLIRPLSIFLEDVYMTAEKRTRIAAAKVQLRLLKWSTEYSECFKNCRNALEMQVTMAHVNYTKRLGEFTDALDHG